MRNIRRFFQTAVYAGAALFLGLSLSGCRKSEDSYQAEHSEELTWFSDLSWWSPGNWDADPKSGTGEITEKTGVEIRYLIPEDNGDTRLSLMMINGNMPDILSVSDEQMIRHLITSDAVWNLDELLQQYLPDSHLLVDYPKDLKTLPETHWHNPAVRPMSLVLWMSWAGRTRSLPSTEVTVRSGFFWRQRLFIS